MRLGFFTQPVHPITRDYREILREDQDAIILADQLGFCEAFVGEHMTDLAEPINTDTRFFSIPLDGEYHDRPQFAGDGTIVFTEQDGRDRMILYDLKGEEVDTYVTNDHGDVRYAYSPSGEYWYIMDTSAGKLVKARTWW